MEKLKNVIEHYGRWNDLSIYIGRIETHIETDFSHSLENAKAPNSNLVNQISSALATIGQQVGELRNEIGVTSHGKSLEEIRERNNLVNLLTREFLIDTVEIVSCFLIRNFENENPRIPSETIEEKLDYREAEEFNDFWDDSFGEFGMGNYSYPASEILFNVDKQAYINEYSNFVANENIEE